MTTIKDIKDITRTTRRGILYPLIDSLGYFPARVIINTKITPNQITIFWIIIQFLSTILVASGKRWTMFVGLVIFQTMFIIDCTDGIIARFKKQFSLNGVYLDYIGHYLNNPLLLICLGIGTYRLFNNITYLGLGLFAALVFLLNKAITLNTTWYPANQKEIIENSAKKSNLQKQNNTMYLIFEMFRLEYLFNIMFWLLLFGYSNYALIIYSLFFSLELLRKMISQYIFNSKSDKKAL
jgi:phosphatidylglycerophosphate synthase